MELVNRRADADWLRMEYAASQRRVCGLMGMAVASYRYRSVRSDEPLRTKLVELAREKPRFGYRRPKPRKSLPRRKQQASTQLSERRGTQTPSLAPRAPPSQLKPRMEKQKVVVFLRERKQGARHNRTYLVSAITRHRILNSQLHSIFQRGTLSQNLVVKRNHR